MSGISVFGFCSVAIMLLSYGLEQRGTVWTLVFALGCVASSAYGWMAHATPIGTLEAIWAVIAFRKWLSRAGLPAHKGVVHFAERIGEMSDHPAFSRSHRFVSEKDPEL